jgi:hypothetical protein
MGPEAFFAEACAAFDELPPDAIDERTIRMAGHAIRLRTAGSRLLGLIEPAFRHLASAPCPADLTVQLWSEAEAGLVLPARPWVPDNADGAAARFSNARFAAMAEFGGSQTWMLDRLAGRAFLCIRDLSAMPYWDRLNPMRLLLAAWSDGLGLHMLHAGGVRFDGPGAIVVGRGGSGKSTTVLACLAAGGRTIGDDLALLDQDPSPVAHSIYGTARLFADHAARFPGLLGPADSADPAEDGEVKLTSYLSVHAGASVIPDMPVAAILVPRIAGDGPTRLAPLAGGAALLALAPATLAQTDPRNRGAFDAMARLCRRLPCFRLELGRDVESIAPAVRACLAQAATQRRPE